MKVSSHIRWQGLSESFNFSSAETLLFSVTSIEKEIVEVSKLQNPQNILMGNRRVHAVLFHWILHFMEKFGKYSESLFESILTLLYGAEIAISFTVLDIEMTQVIMWRCSLTINLFCKAQTGISPWLFQHIQFSSRSQQTSKRTKRELLLSAFKNPASTLVWSK